MVPAPQIHVLSSPAVESVLVSGRRCLLLLCGEPAAARPCVHVTSVLDGCLLQDSSHISKDKFAPKRAPPVP